jgi:hypothetical protein
VKLYQVGAHTKYDLKVHLLSRLRNSLKKFSGLILLPSHQGRGRLRDCDKFPDEMIEKYIPEQAREPVQEDSRFVVDNA